MIEVVSYDNVNGLKFGATPEETIKIFGEPDSISKDQSDFMQFHYKDFTINFYENDIFKEFILSPCTKAKINGVEIGWTLKEILNVIKLDKDPRMDDDGITLYDLGVYIYAFESSDDDDFSNKTISFFARGNMDEFKEATKPFDLEEIKQYIKERELDIVL